MHSRVIALAAAALALGGCSQLFPEPVSGTQSIVVVTYDVSNESYSLQPVNVTTLQDLRTMQGAAADVVADATVNASYADLLKADATSASAVRSVAVTHAGQPVDFDYFTVDGSIYPADADALNIATAYYELEQSYLFFQQAKAELPTPPDLYYFPALSVAAGTPLSVTDLGVTDPWLGFFVVPTATVSNWLEPGLQPGVVAYQYAQAVFAQQVFGGPGLSWLDTGAAQSPASYAPTVNLVRSFDAAFSDTFAAIIVGDPDFVHTSGATIDQNRRLDPPSPRCLTSAVQMDVATLDRQDYDPHLLGSIISVALYNTYATRPDLQDSYPASLVTALTAFGQLVSMQKSTAAKTPLSLATAVNTLAGSIEESAQVGLCGMLLDRLDLTISDVPNCSDASTPAVSCAP